MPSEQPQRPIKVTAYHRVDGSAVKEFDAQPPRRQESRYNITAVPMPAKSIHVKIPAPSEPLGPRVRRAMEIVEAQRREGGKEIVAVPASSARETNIRAEAVPVCAPVLCGAGIQLDPAGRPGPLGSAAPVADAVTVTTASQLKRAIEEHQNRIYISGKLAKRVRKTEKLKTLSAVGLTAVAGLAAAGAVGAAAAPATGGASTVLYFAAVKTAAVTTGMSVPTLLLIAMVGLTAISTLLDEYTKVHLPGGILFERKRHRSAAPVSRPAPVPKVEAVPKEGGPKT